ncbi:flagellar hook-length control protein FliK [Prosthecodimorpha staleyi]|uniref:Flagellar hook-length control protein FliK n=1 Tax=Prosthecodimorpha staleyi TaxID=2840188 RepID=A0A947GCI8_9HYPH|nr:flagellar hook-length control protein FliK [Prosthecodimorpha staleyi]MBT9289236.1 flagellar hook-length control protein FliK [Prosthecodimorpha staleyi]
MAAISLLPAGAQTGTPATALAAGGATADGLFLDFMANFAASLNAPEAAAEAGGAAPQLPANARRRPGGSDDPTLDAAAAAAQAGLMASALQAQTPVPILFVAGLGSSPETATAPTADAGKTMAASAATGDAAGGGAAIQPAGGPDAGAASPVGIRPGATGPGGMGPGGAGPAAAVNAASTPGTGAAVPAASFAALMAALGVDEAAAPADGIAPPSGASARADASAAAGDRPAPSAAPAAAASTPGVPPGAGRITVRSLAPGAARGAASGAPVTAASPGADGSIPASATAGSASEAAAPSPPEVVAPAATGPSGAAKGGGTTAAREASGTSPGATSIPADAGAATGKTAAKAAHQMADGLEAGTDPAEQGSDVRAVDPAAPQAAGTRIAAGPGLAEPAGHAHRDAADRNGGDRDADGSAIDAATNPGDNSGANPGAAPTFGPGKGPDGLHDAAATGPGAADTARGAPAEQVAAAVQSAAARSDKRLEIRLDPPELGKVDIRMQIGNDGEVRAHLVVERAETLDMMLRDQRGLERSLEQSGMKLADNGVSFSLRQDGGQPGGDGWRNPYGADRRGDAAQASDEEIALPAALPYRRPERAGGIDLSV